jgi:hypothetical protein
MKYFIVCAVETNGTEKITNMIATDEKTPIEWISEMNNIWEKDQTIVRKFKLVNYWKLSDHSASILKDDGLGYITRWQFSLKEFRRNKK